MAIYGDELQHSPVHVIRPSEHGLTDLMDPSTAEPLADRVLSALRGGVVEVDLRDMVGITTAFANLFFERLFEAMPASAVRRSLRLRTSNAMQREVLRRSAEAVAADGRGDTTVGS
jgi:hypothetical protein